MKTAGCVAAFALLIAPATAVGTHDYTLNELRIVHPYATPTVPAQANGAVYFTLDNRGRQAMRLVRASSPAALRVEVHHMAMDGNVARMREAGSISVKGGETVKMAPSAGYHLMLVSLRQPLREGERFPLVLEFEPAGKVEVSVYVQKAPQGSRPASEHHH